MTTTKQKGNLPLSFSFVEIDSEDLILTTIKKAEKTPEVIFRLYETAGNSSQTKIRFFHPIRTSKEVDLLEKDISRIRSDRGNPAFIVSPYEIKTIRIELDEYFKDSLTID